MDIKVEIKKLEKSEVEITGAILAEDFESYRNKAVESVSKNIKIDGFREGKVPEDILIKRVGEHSVLEMMAELALQDAYPQIVEGNEIKAIGRPMISITKIAKGNPLEFKIKTAVVPLVELPDYKKIAKGVKAIDEKEIIVEDKEIDDSIEYLRKSRAKIPEGNENIAEENLKEGGEDGENEKSEGNKSIPEQILPELNDEFAQSLGEFKTVDDLKKALRENLLTEKKQKAIQKRRGDIMEKIVEKTKTEIPQLLIDSEVDRMKHEMKSNVAQSGLKWEDYLKHLKKEESELNEDWREDAEKRVKFGLVLEKIAETEKIENSEDEITAEVEKIISYYKSFKQEVDPNRTRSYTDGIIKNEKVFKLLEEL